MASVRGHFDGKVIVLDEPADLRAGETVTIIRANDTQLLEGPKAGSAKDKIWMAPDFDEPLEDFKEYTG